MCVRDNECETLCIVDNVAIKNIIDFVGLVGGDYGSRSDGDNYKDV